MGKILDFPEKPDLAKLCEEFDTIVAICVSPDTIQVVSNMSDTDILYSMEIAKNELVQAYYQVDEEIH
jgi:hypothetical protein